MTTSCARRRDVKSPTDSWPALVGPAVCAGPLVTQDFGRKALSLRREMARLTAVCVVVVSGLHVAALPVVAQPASDAKPAQSAGATSTPPAATRMSLGECISFALKNNRRREVARDGIGIAESQITQARSAYWPELSLQAKAMHLDEDPNFIFPSSTIPVPASTIPVPSQRVTIPANAFAPGLPPANVPLNTPASTVNVPAQSFTIPKQTVKVMDRDNAVGTVNLMFPIYTGGLRSAKLAQAKAGLEAARQEARRADLEIVYDVKRAYYAAVLCGQLVEIAEDSLVRMAVTLELTERLYKTGSGRVKKTDYLRHHASVESLRSIASALKDKDRAARAGLVIAMGMPWDTPIDPSEKEIPFSPQDAAVDSLVDAAHRNNADLGRMKAALAAAGEEVKAAKSGHHPKAAILGSAGKILNSYDAGIVSPENRNFWSVGVGVEVSVFDGFRTRARVAEARMRQHKLEMEERLLRDRIALEVEQLASQARRCQEQEKSSRGAMQSAIENRDLTIRAYQDELMETKDVIEAQLLAAFLIGQYRTVLYEGAESRSKLDFLLGDEARQGFERDE